MRSARRASRGPFTPVMRFLRRGSAGRGAGKPSPNVLLLMTDQQRWDALGCSGGWVRTANVDRLAAEGMRFTHAYTNSPVYVPARVSLATGRHPHNTGVWATKRHTLPPNSPTWMRAMRDAGYHTSLFGVSSRFVG